MAEGIITRKGGSSGEDLNNFKLRTELIIYNCNWVAPKAKDQKFSVRIFGGGGGTIGEYGGGGGGYMNNDIITISQGSIIPINIGLGGSSNGGTTIFGTYLSANGGGVGTPNVIAGSGGSGGGGCGLRQNGGIGYQFGGGGASGIYATGNYRNLSNLNINATYGIHDGGNGGIWGGGGGGSGPISLYTNGIWRNLPGGKGGKGGQYGGNGGDGGKAGNAGTNTMNIPVEFPGEGKGGSISNYENSSYNSIYFARIYPGGGGGGGYGGCGGDIIKSSNYGEYSATSFTIYGTPGSGGGGYGSNGGIGKSMGTMGSGWVGAGGGGGYGNDGDNGGYGSAGGGGGGYGIWGFGHGGTSNIERTASYNGSVKKSGYGSQGICIIQYYI